MVVREAALFGLPLAEDPAAADAEWLPGALEVAAAASEPCASDAVGEEGPPGAEPECEWDAPCSECDADAE